jgi:Otopetrin
VRASLVEAQFFGFMPWIIIQRVTLPLSVFFHFHAAVVCSQLFKEVYTVREEEALHEANPPGAVSGLPRTLVATKRVP